MANASIYLGGNTIVVRYPSGKTYSTGITVGKEEDQSAIAGKVASAKTKAIGAAPTTEDAVAVNNVNAGAVAAAIYRQLNPPATVEAAPKAAQQKPATPAPKPEPKKQEPKIQMPRTEPKKEEPSIRESTPRQTVSQEWIVMQLQDAGNRSDYNARNAVSNLHRQSEYVKQHLEAGATRTKRRSENGKAATIAVFNALYEIPKFRLYLASQASSTPEFAMLQDYMTSESNPDGKLDEKADDSLIQAADFYTRHFLIAFEARLDGDGKYLEEAGQLSKIKWRAENSRSVTGEPTAEQKRKRPDIEESWAHFRRMYLAGPMDAETITLAAVYIRRYKQEKEYKRPSKFVGVWQAPDVIPIQGEVEIKVPDIAIVGASICADGRLAEYLLVHLKADEEKANVRNYSRSGRSSADMNRVFDTTALNPGAHHNIIIISGYGRINEKNHLSVVKKNYERMIADAKAKGMKVIVFGMGPFAGWRSYDAAWQKRADEFNKWLSENPDITYVDISALGEGKPPRLRKMYDSGDGLHLNPRGKRALARLILQQGFGVKKKMATPVEEYAENNWKSLEETLSKAAVDGTPEVIARVELEMPADVKGKLPQGKQNAEGALHDLGREDIAGAFMKGFNEILQDPAFVEFATGNKRYEKVPDGKLNESSTDTQKKVAFEAVQYFLREQSKKDEKFRKDLEILVGRDIFGKPIVANGSATMHSLAALSLYIWRKKNPDAPVGQWARGLPGVKVPGYKTEVPAPKTETPEPKKDEPPKKRVLRF